MHEIIFSPSSVLITLLVVSVLILFLHFLLTQNRNYRLYKTDFISALIVVIVLRLLLPVELPFTKTINIQFFMNAYHTFMNYRFLNMIDVKMILCLVWIIGTIICLIRYFIVFIKVNQLYQNIYHNGAIYHLSDFHLQVKEDYEVLVSKLIPNPMIIGFHKVICIHELDIPDEQMKYILLHELQHIRNKDAVIKLLVSIIFFVFWWFPPVNLLKNDIQLFLEMRVDSMVTKQLSEVNTLHYAKTLINIQSAIRPHQSVLNNRAFASNLISENTKILEYRVHYLMDNKYINKTNRILLVSLALIPFLSNAIVLEPDYSSRMEEEGGYSIGDLKEQGAYIIHHQDGTYSLCWNAVISQISESSVNDLSKQLEIREEGN